MASSITEICNNALIYLGEEPINDIDENTKPARMIKNIFNIVAKSELSECDWNFARKEIEITNINEEVYDGLELQNNKHIHNYYIYQIPNDCLKFIGFRDWPHIVLSDFINQDTSQYQIYQDRIKTHIGPTAWIRYVSDVSNQIHLFTPIFCELVACKIAMRLSNILKGSDSSYQMANNDYNSLLKRAQRQNASQLPPVYRPDTSLILAHRIGGSFR